MVRANIIRINKYKSEYIIKLIGVYIRQKWYLVADSIDARLCNINGEIFRMNYTNVNNIVWLYNAVETCLDLQDVNNIASNQS